MLAGRKVRALALGLAATMGLSACVTVQDDLGQARVLAPKPVSLDAYAWLDRSDALLDAIAQSPPDFSFDHAGQQFYAWEVEGVLIVEEVGANGYVLYLYDEGQDWPFFIRTPDEAAGFDGQELAVVYTRDGDVLVDADRWGSNPRFQPLQLRGREVRLAARQSRWDRSAAQAWVAVEAFVSATRNSWDERWRADREWELYRTRIEAEADRARLQGERRRRRDAGQDFRRWREGGFNGAPPRRRDRDGDGRPDRPRDREDRPNRPDGGVTRPDRSGDGRPDRPNRPGGPDRPDRPRDRDDRPVPPVVQPRPEQPRPGPRPAPPVDETLIAPERPEPEYRPTAPDRLSRPRVADEAPPQDSSAIISREELLRSEEERDRRAWAAASCSRCAAILPG